MLFKVLFYRLLGFLLVSFLIKLPKFVMHNNVATMNTPGNTITHQDPVISALSPRDNMLPHDITSIGRPSPRKLRVDSVVIHVLTDEITTNIIAERKLGNKCCFITYKNFPPQLLAYSTYSPFLICLTSLLTILARLNHPTIPITNERLITLLACIVAYTISVKSIVGILPHISTALIIADSTFVLEVPAILP